MLTTSTKTLTDADLTLLREKKEETKKRGEIRIREYAEVLSRDIYSDVERMSAARWFDSITRSTGLKLHSATQLKEVLKGLGVETSGIRSVLESRLLQIPGL